MNFVFSEEIKNHKKRGRPVLALESTILAHGMPYPDNYKFAKTVEKNCRDMGVAPATIAVLDGRIHIGLSDSELKRLEKDIGELVRELEVVKSTSEKEVWEKELSELESCL